ncbi:MAG TPA: HAMP domain-containing sensor histidine kinase [Stellaceae bacterium]|nr:HAMP domain-containing sensor histidine kinase [Stellaceae bacterium]
MRPEGKIVRSVLLVDAEAGFAERIAAMLRPIGYATLHADTAERALALLRDPPDDGDPPAVALIDVRLGDSARGLDLIPRLRAEHPDLLCVLLSGAPLDGDTALAAVRRGACDCLDKACGIEALSGVLDRCFDRVALQLEREASYEALRLAKDAAEAASRGKSGFLATMSHELRTPLNAIIGFSEIMLREVLGALPNENYRAYVADIHDSGTHLLRIINDVLDLSKAEAGKLELHEELFDLRDTVRSVRQLISDRMRKGDLSELVELPAGLPLLHADERKTKQVLLNLVSNAVKFTPPGGRVAIAAQFDKTSGLTISVADTGIGIAPDDLPRVLQPFEQVDSFLSRSHPGTGLGLPLVKAIMELHGGTIKLHSELGVGTRASVTFPPSRAILDERLEKPRCAAA